MGYPHALYGQGRMGESRKNLQGPTQIGSQKRNGQLPVGADLLLPSELPRGPQVPGGFVKNVSFRLLFNAHERVDPVFYGSKRRSQNAV